MLSSGLLLGYGIFVEDDSIADGSSFWRVLKRHKYIITLYYPFAEFYHIKVLSYKSFIILKGLFSRRKLLICAIRHRENPIATNKIKIGQLVVFLISP
jgi:hypothetical protein